MAGLMTEKFLDTPPETPELQSETVSGQDQHPELYLHETCGTATQMPRHIRQNYLADPYFYNGDTICAECGVVADTACRWVDTGENLHDYMRRLQKAKTGAYHIVRWCLPLVIGMFITLFGAYLKANKGEAVTPEVLCAAFVFGVAIAWYPSKFIRLFLCKVDFI